MKVLLIIIAYILIFLGTISIISPIPGAVLLLAVGLSLLICTSTAAASCIRFTRNKSSKLNILMSWIENHSGERMGSILKQTRPDAEILTLSLKLKD